MLFSLWGLKTTTDQREKNRTRPGGSPADESVKSLQRKRREEMFNCLTSLCSTRAWLWNLEAPEVASGLQYHRPKISRGWHQTFLLAVFNWRADNRNAAELWEALILWALKGLQKCGKKTKNKTAIWKVTKGTEASAQRLLSHPEHQTFNLLVWEHPWTSPLTGKVQICGSLY